MVKSQACFLRKEEAGLSLLLVKLRGSVPAGAAHRMNFRPERRTAGKGALGAAKRTLDGEHRSGTGHELRWAAQGELVPAGGPGALRSGQQCR